MDSKLCSRASELCTAHAMKMRCRQCGRERALDCEGVNDRKRCNSASGYGEPTDCNEPLVA